MVLTQEVAAVTKHVKTLGTTNRCPGNEDWDANLHFTGARHGDEEQPLVPPLEHIPCTAILTS